MPLIIIIKYFIISAGVWNLLDGIVSIRVTYLGHTKLADFCRLIRTFIGLGLIIAGVFI